MILAHADLGKSINSVTESLASGCKEESTRVLTICFLVNSTDKAR